MYDRRTKFMRIMRALSINVTKTEVPGRIRHDGTRQVVVPLLMSQSSSHSPRRRKRYSDSLLRTVRGIKAKGNHQIITRRRRLPTDYQDFDISKADDFVRGTGRKRGHVGSRRQCIVF